MRRKHLDLIVTGIIACMNSIWIVIPAHLPLVGLVLALPLVFVLPGYMLVEIFFHRRSLDPLYHFLLSLGLSLAIDILAGFILNILPVGLREISWGVFLSLLATFFSLLVAFLRRKTTRNKDLRLFPQFRVRLSDSIFCILALIIVIFSVAYSAASVIEAPRPGFTQFWMLPSDQRNDSCAVRLGVQSFETTTVTYRIEMFVNGNQESLSQAVLLPQEKWNRFVPLRLKTTKTAYVVARLYRLDEPDVVYRTVNLLLYLSQQSRDENVLVCRTS